jgi:hypothetical protein
MAEEIFEPITKEEIEYAEKILLPEGQSFDEDERRKIIREVKSCCVEACPGSGKTTVLIAKLIILANRMPLKNNKGICVLTHTNVAIEEIKKKLGAKSDVLFKYPNYFGTLQSFIDKYLAIPCYKEKYKRNIEMIDDAYVDAIYSKIKYWNGLYPTFMRCKVKVKSIKYNFETEEYSFGNVNINKSNKDFHLLNGRLENNYIRFDMSEFSQEHSNQRLVGAPPGYVGYEMGGELTNAIKENPFTVILFDEIEKAHPKIMDIFLQILDDGRITSSRGDTVYLSESIIIFTSNLGIYEITSSNERIENVNNSMEYEDIHNKILSSIQNHFKFKLQRPEILNRIGENIVVFDFIREENARKIFTKMLNSIIINLQENHKIYLEFKNGSEKVLEMNCIVDLTMGGRGIGNHIESIFINPLSRKLFELGAKENDTIVIEEIYKDDYKWALKANKKSI